MKKLLLTIFSIALFFGVGTAQKAKVKISPEMKMRKADSFAGHLLSDETGHYVYFIKRKNRFSFNSYIQVVKYDKKLNEVWAKDYMSDKKDVVSYGLKPLKDKFLWMLTDEPKRKTIDYYLQPIGMDGKAGKKTKLTTVKYEKNNEIPFINWSVSEDSSKVVIALINDRDRKKDNFGYYIKVVDADLNEVWSKRIKTSKSQEQMEILDAVVGNDGACYLLMKEYDNRNAKEGKRVKGKKRKVPAFDIKIYRLADGEEKPSIIDLDLGSKFAKGASLKVAENGEITCVGMFSNLRRGNLNGVYYLKMDTKGTVISSNLKEFSQQQLGFLGKKNRDKDKDGDEGLEGRFSFGEQVVFEDGSIVLTAEENYSITRCDNRGNCRTTYYSKDIIVIQMDAEGTIQQVRVIPKKQITPLQEYGSHIAMPVEGQGVYFIYNDDEDNMKRDLSQKAKRISSYGDCVTACTHVSPEGKMKRKPLVEYKELKSLLLPYACKKIGPNEMFFVGMRPKLLAKSNFRMGTITFE